MSKDGIANSVKYLAVIASEGDEILFPTELSLFIIKCFGKLNILSLRRFNYNIQLAFANF